MKYYVSHILLGLILLVSLFLRVNQLQSIPVGMTDDEVRLVYSAYSLWHTGRDVANNFFLPASFVLHNFSFAPVSVYITAPFVGLLGVTPFSARLPFALSGLGVVLLTYLVVRRLLKQQSVALIAAGILAVNVWAIQLSRMAYESGFALLFYLAGVYVFVGDWKKCISPVIVSMVLLFLGFHSYNATKFLYLPILFLLTWYKWNDMRRVRSYVTCILVSLSVTLISFWYFSAVQGAGEHGGYISVLQNTPAASQAVELARRASAAPGVLSTLFHNKVTYFTDVVLRHYLYAFSPDFLFLNQEGSGIYSLWGRGNFYLLELPFLLVGIVAMWIRRRKLFLLTAALLLISALPSGIGPEPFTYATRSSFMLPWMALFIAFGLVTVIHGIRQRTWKALSILTICVLYAFSIGGYITQYYFEWPRYSAKSYAKDQKDIVSYIRNYPDASATFLITNVSDMFFLHYALYTQMDPRILQALYTQSPVPDSLGRIRVRADCAPEIPQGVVYIASQSCHTQEPDDVITLPDGQKMWSIYLKVPSDTNLPE